MSSIENNFKDEWDRLFNAEELLKKLEAHNRDLDNFKSSGSAFTTSEGYSNEEKLYFFNELIKRLEDKKESLEADRLALHELRETFEKDFEITKENKFRLVLSDINPVLTEYINTIKRVDNAIVRIKEHLSNLKQSNENHQNNQKKLAAQDPPIKKTFKEYFRKTETFKTIIDLLKSNDEFIKEPVEGEFYWRKDANWIPVLNGILFDRGYIHSIDNKKAPIVYKEFFHLENTYGTLKKYFDEESEYKEKFGLKFWFIPDLNK